MTINILSMIEDDEPASQVKGTVVLYSSSDNLAKAPERFTRNEKLAYIEVTFSRFGNKGDSDQFVKEFYISRGLSRQAFNASRQYGLHVYNSRKATRKSEQR